MDYVPEYPASQTARHQVLQVLLLCRNNWYPRYSDDGCTKCVAASSSKCISALKTKTCIQQRHRLTSMYPRERCSSALPGVPVDVCTVGTFNSQPVPSPVTSCSICLQVATKRRGGVFQCLEGVSARGGNPNIITRKIQDPCMIVVVFVFVLRSGGKWQAFDGG